ncbi:AAA family ATPase [Streptomyces europaeiscabiei]|uniref:AAA family ATPase n=2 Tax=Streptomyces europaeiscabiei TaxID=146819 RepID=A0AAJ2UL78_9ACTN|nr:AAA family ATPase [Streptomyces europaeiscabiei]MDX3130650.1 AAA family ATPase [Streptomyces europaeiscabiei]
MIGYGQRMKRGKMMAAPAETGSHGNAGPAGASQPSGGLIIFLNGTSSSGKSSIAKALLTVLDDMYFHMPVDILDAMRSQRAIAPDELPSALRRALMGFHRAVAGMAAGGNNVVVDHVLSEPWQLLDCIALFAPEDVVLVGVHCPLQELERREQERGDRAPGLAARQITQVHAHSLYDIECDTSTASPADCAQQIKDFLPHRSTPTAFEKLRANPPAEQPSAS